MSLIFESLFVAIYSCIIFTIIKYGFHLKFFSLFFLTGFFKHFIGWLTGLQVMYCHYKKTNILSNFAYTDYKHIFSNKKMVKVSLESIVEGILFVLFGIVLHFIQNEYIIICIIGGGLHILFDIVNIHTWFCNNLNIYYIKNQLINY
jgi:hypothetical protein